MIVDFHTHVFPDKIAQSTINKLEEAGNIKAFANGTYDNLKKSMKESRVDLSVVLPVVTNPGQFESINKYAKSISDHDGIISFGGIHPDSDDIEVEIKTLKKLNFPGIKLHPDYQDTFIDDEKYVRLISYALSQDLIVSIHAGCDASLAEPVHCTPKRVSVLLDRLDELLPLKGCRKLIFAHTGGINYWDDVEKYMVGRGIYLDCSYSLGKISDEQFNRIVRNNGFDKMLFATDSPWDGQKEDINYLMNMGFSQNELDMMLFKNASDLLGQERIKSALATS